MPTNRKVSQMAVGVELFSCTNGVVEGVAYSIDIHKGIAQSVHKLSAIVRRVHTHQHGERLVGAPVAIAHGVASHHIAVAEIPHHAVVGIADIGHELYRASSVEIVPNTVGTDGHTVHKHIKKHRRSYGVGILYCSAYAINKGIAPGSG